ncbi:MULTISPECIES: GatB/YqeY domain-containing protein [Aneurinibacillus]|uniref:GatB/YqeY domain-containing protein n=1 Tax=Aneurinibacillus thermoaerophilus TaxID=143495 RepID=A0A1G7Z4P8_ANETH|nr:MULTISPECIES: GatB/YqeY domain-containing protein [Aneurinibacillus]AMA72355.1 aspartyl-tRNA amidotransferase [Aneurinibacillus sp. XH2]MED0674789.1 GatB/YqeY domain-containing protein [Aneurinibacillus thermoaerophilus]MED0679740.1 GatB/YqeY domain-containing protein [Aneurinibacillus thermoaerophilus]MED0735771.1 GatB/YqeY domain-containing protein [Aneurinibacillus thermoaerophilus]MED0757979.1 GatB/YqeY domain-containing protein [Aneurinibacillus thermoaerophilus]
MRLIDRLTNDMKQAMKDKDKLKLSVIRLVKSAIKNEEINQGKELSDDEVLTVLTRELKQRRDSLQEFEKAGRDDLATSARDEIKILMEYMPEQLSEDEIRTLVKEAIEQTGASSKKDMGKVMGALMPKVKGRADGSLVNKIVQESLS